MKTATLYHQKKKDNQPKKDIDGYTYITTNVDEKGNVGHVYAKTTTSYVDNNGNPIVPSEDGEQPNKDIPGYTYVTTKTEGGKTIHVYTPVTPETKTTTSYVDGDGNPVAPSEDDNQPNKDIPGYKYVTTTVDKDGNVTGSRTSYTNTSSSRNSRSQGGIHST